MENKLSSDLINLNESPLPFDELLFKMKAYDWSRKKSCFFKKILPISFGLAILVSGLLFRVLEGNLAFDMVWNFTQRICVFTLVLIPIVFLYFIEHADLKNIAAKPVSVDELIRINELASKDKDIKEYCKQKPANEEFLCGELITFEQHRFEQNELQNAQKSKDHLDDLNRKIRDQID